MILIEEKNSVKVPGITSLFVSFPYKKELIDIIKNEDVTVYNKNDKTWEIPVTGLQRFVDSACIFDDITIIPYRQQKKQVANKVVLDEQSFKTKLFKHQIDAIEYGLEKDKWLLLDSPGLGKAVTLDTPVLTPNGYKPMLDIQVGDIVFDNHGNKCKVLHTYYHDDLEMYRITFSDDTYVECCKDHLWKIEYDKTYRNCDGKEMSKMIYDVRTTQWIFDNYIKENEITFPRCEPVQFDKKELPIHPYIIGCLLGNGSIKKAIRLTSANEFIVEKVKKFLPDGVYLKNTGQMEYRISKISGKYNNLAQNLKSLGLYGKDSHTKFIPDLYKYSSVEDRISLLQGLLDTDGCATKDNLLQYTTVSKKLFDDFIFLVESIGGIVNISSKKCGYYSKKLNTYVCTGVAYTGTVETDNPSLLVSLPRKKELLKPRKFLPRRLLKSIEKIENKSGKCITVDSPESLYLIKDCIVTHNTLDIIYIAQELKKQGKIEHCLVICGINTLKMNWKREIEKHSELSCRILGQRINRNGKLVIGSVQNRIDQLKEKIDEFFVISNIETIRSDDIVKLINDGKNKFDMIVVDEAHCIKSISAQQTKNLLKLNNAKYRIAATGTLLTNSPLDAYVPLKWVGEEKSNFTNFKKYYCQLGGPFGNIPIGYKNLDVLKEQIDRVSLRRTKDILNLPPKNIIREKLEMTDQQETFYNNIKAGIISQVDKVRMTKFTTQSVLAMVTRLRQATSCPSVLTSEKIESSKILRAVDLAQQLVDNGDKVVIFSVFKETADVLYDKLKDYKPLLNTGDIPDKEIQENINKFQTDDKCKIFIGTFAKCSTGITLNKASYMICVDSCWTAALCQQAEDRIHRIGSTQPVFIYYLSCENTIDDRVEEIVMDKGAISDYVVDDQVSEQQMESLKKYLLEMK